MRRDKRFHAVASALLCALLLTVFVASNGYILPRANTGMNIDFGLVFGDPEPETPTATTFAPSTNYPFADMQANISSHAAVNGDVKGWLTVPNTNINYPVVYYASNNSYYEYRDWRGTYYPNTNYKNYSVTATYLDYRTRFGSTWQASSKNTVLYGHNWNNLRDPMVIGNNPAYTMFGQLPSYTSIDFARANPHIYYSTGENEGVWRVFSVAYCELSSDFFYNNPNPTTASYEKLIGEWQARSLFDFGVDVDANDRIITLTTCTRRYDGIGAYQRYCVVARLLRPGESENDAVTVSVNPNVKNPDFSRIGNTSTAAAATSASATQS